MLSSFKREFLSFDKIPKIFFTTFFFVLDTPTDQRSLLLALSPLLVQYNNEADQGNRAAATITFEKIYQLLVLMPQYITDPQARQFFIDNYINKSHNILISLRNGSGDLSLGKSLLSPLFNIVGNVLNGLGGAVSADINGLVKGLSTAINLLAKGDIIGAAAYGIGDILSGKVNAINSILGIFG